MLELALREALSLGHNYIGTEHILLGLVREIEGVAARILLDFDADAEKLRDAVILMLSGSPRAASLRDREGTLIRKAREPEAAWEGRPTPELPELHHAPPPPAAAFGSRSRRFGGAALLAATVAALRGLSKNPAG